MRIDSFKRLFSQSAPGVAPDGPLEDRDVTDKLAKALADIGADPAIVKRFEELGITTVKMSSAEFGAFVVKQINDWAPAIKAADVKN